MDNRSRYRRDKCCGMRVEKTCYIFAVINVVIVSLCVVTCISTMGLIIILIMINMTNNSLSQYLPTWRGIYPVYAIVCFVIAIYGIFAMLLLQGIRMNKPKLIKAYLLFGLIVEALMIMGIATYIAVVVNLRSPSSAILNAGIALAIAICVVYGFILNLVRRAYLVLSSRSKRNNSDNEQTVLYICEN